MLEILTSLPIQIILFYVNLYFFVEGSHNVLHLLACVLLAISIAKEF